MPRVGLILLAAGSSTRLGEPKQLIRYQGKTLLRRAAETALASSCHPVIVVLGAGSDQLLLELGDLPLQTVVNPEWQSGMSSSIRCGIEALDPDVNAAVIMVCDQPLLTSTRLDLLTDKHLENADYLVASEYGGVAGVPALVPRIYFEELCNLPAAEGARSLLRRYSERVARVPFPEGLIDIDSRADVENLID